LSNSSRSAQPHHRDRRSVLPWRLTWPPVTAPPNPGPVET
jgi:hypothetical protein